MNLFFLCLTSILKRETFLTPSPKNNQYCDSKDQYYQTSKNYFFIADIFDCNFRCNVLTVKPCFTNNLRSPNHWNEIFKPTFHFYFTTIFIYDLKSFLPEVGLLLKYLKCIKSNWIWISNIQHTINSMASCDRTTNLSLKK